MSSHPLIPWRHIATWLCVAGVWYAASGAVSGFVRPWVRLQVKSKALGEAVGRVSDDAAVQALAEKLAKRVGRIAIQVRQPDGSTIGGELPNIAALPRQLSGYDIPRLLHRSDMQGLVSLAELLLKERGVARKSYAVYLLPGVALLLAVLLTVAVRRRVVAVVLGLASLAISGTLWWKLAALRAETPMIRLVIDVGLWQTCTAYALLGVAALGLAAAMPPLSRRAPLT